MSVGRKGGARFSPNNLKKLREDYNVRQTRNKRIFEEEWTKQQIERPTVYLVKDENGQWVPRETVVAQSDVTPPWVD